MVLSDLDSCSTEDALSVAFVVLLLADTLASSSCISLEGFFCGGRVVEVLLEVRVDA